MSIKSKFDQLIDEIRELGADGIADALDDLSYCDLLQVIIDDSDIEQCLAALDYMADEEDVDLADILATWKKNNAAAKEAE